MPSKTAAEHIGCNVSQPTTDQLVKESILATYRMHGPRKGTGKGVKKPQRITRLTPTVKQLTTEIKQLRYDLATLMCELDEPCSAMRLPGDVIDTGKIINLVADTVAEAVHKRLQFLLDRANAALLEDFTHREVVQHGINW